MSDGTSYYWAGKRRIPLLPTTEVVLDLDSPALRGMPLAGLRAEGRPLSGSLVVVPRAEAQQALGDATATAPGVHPVFRTEDGTLVAVLPQVRVEAADPRTLDEAVRSTTTARVTERTGERVVLEPESGRGEDALTLANELAESSAADVSQARFVRVVPRPGS